MKTKHEHFLGLGRKVRAFIHAGERSERGFEELALELFQFQFQNNAPYQRYCRALKKTPDRVNSWPEIPSVVTSSFKTSEWTVLEPAERTTLFLSSGTTLRDRSKHHHSPDSLAVYETSLLQGFKPRVLPDLPRAEFILLTPDPASAPNSSLVHMLDVVARVFGGGKFYGALREDHAWQLDFPRLAAAKPQGPVVLCGTAFSFVHLCDWLSQSQTILRFPEGSRVFETGGYKGRSREIAKPELHQMIEGHLGIPQDRIISEYGMSELSSQAYDRLYGSSAPRVFQFPPWTRVQLIDPETGGNLADGQAGLIRVFDLANLGSVLAVQTEDMGVRRGDGFELLGRAALVEPRGCSLMPA